jgi:hypothetical protein
MNAVEKVSLHKNKAGGDKTPPNEKLKEVIDGVQAQLAEHKLPQKAAEDIEAIINSKLHIAKQGATNGVSTTVVVGGENGKVQQ